MKRKLSVILAAAMLASSFGMSAMAEESVQARFTDYDQVNQAITVIAGDGYPEGIGVSRWRHHHSGGGWAQVQGLERQWSSGCL